MDGKSPLRITPTHSGIDSRGVMKVPGGLELEGSSYLLLIAGVFGSLLMMMIMMISKTLLIVKIGAILLPLAGSVAWHLTMVQGRPPAFQSDFFATLLDGKDFFLRPLPWSKKPHPLTSTQAVRTS